MSLDLHLYCECCDQDSHHSLNITHNLSRMWIEANPDVGWLDLDGMTGMESLPHLEKGLAELRAKPEHFKQFDSPNGWGIHKHLVSFIERVIAAARQYPKLKWRTSR